MTIALLDSKSQRSVLSAELLEPLAHAYRTGTTRRTEKYGYLAEQRDWWEANHVFSLAQFTVPQRAIYTKGKASCQEARKLAMRGEVTEALRCIAIAEYLFQGLRMSSTIAALARSEVFAAEAAVEYQAGDFRRSRELLTAARTVDRFLSEQSGQLSSLAHGFHLIGKQIQLEAAEQNYVMALRLAAAGLAALGGRRASDESAPWPLAADSVDLLPSPLRQFLSRQLVVEIGAAMLVAPVGAATEALRYLSGDLECDPGLLALDAMALEWLQAKLLSVDPLDVQLHLQACTVFLQNQRRGSETLWLMCALDAAKACAHQGNASARRFRRNVFSDLSQHEPFGQRLRLAWARLADRE